MEFLILGPLEVRDERGPLSLGGTKPRAVLAVLLLHPNSFVSAERLAAALWGEDAPAGAVKTVQVHVSRLRKALGGGDVIETAGGGYRLRVRPENLDATRFERLVDEGERAFAVGDAERATVVLRSALELWRGPPLSDVAAEPFAAAEIARLEEQRLTATEARVEADLALGREAQLVGELQGLVTEHPLRERLAAQLMIALYRSGRQADALGVYRETRRVLVAEVGVEPGPDLRRLHAAILRQDRALLGHRVAELPRELEHATAVQIEGRDAELAWLRERWQRVNAGTGALVTLQGEHGIGKSRLAAEFAAEAHAHGATVLYADGGGPPAATLSVLARARQTPGPRLLVVDDADRAPAAVRDELATLGHEVAGVPLLALVVGRGGGSVAPGDALELSPLDLGAVHAIVTRYVPEQESDDPPAEWLLGASRGVPRHVHELARQWARRAAGRRVESGAERAASRRADLQALERELAADVAVLEAAREVEPPERGNGALVCPFKGLATFQVADAPYFFGRERLVAELVARLVGSSLLGVVGPSGSGKSSVLRAGLLPALGAGVLPGSERWHQILIRPGAHPLGELSAALAGAPQRPIVLAVDQFEETFTNCREEQERTAFVAELTRLARDWRGEGAVVLAIRADFYGPCAEYPELSRLLAASQVLVGAMSEDELRRAVECPAQRAGLVIERELVAALVGDVEGEPGALPLLSTALLELWPQRDGRLLRHAAYQRAGGVHGAVARLGERAFARLDTDQRQVARRVLMRLASVDEEGGAERRRVSRKALGAEGAAEVVELLAESRLLTVYAGTVELAHEALLREWPRLREWIEEDRDALRVYARLRSGGAEWRRLDRDDGALLRGAQLAEARESVDPSAPDLDDAEREFLAASLERDRRERRGRRRGLELLFGALATALVAIGVVALMAVDRQGDAERERNVALSRSLALQSGQTLDTDPELALRLALWADEIYDTPATAAALRQATLAFRQRAVLPADPVTARTAAFSPDGTRIVTGGDAGEAVVWDAATRRKLRVLEAGGAALLTARFSPDGSRIALGFDDGTVKLTDASLLAGRDALTAGAAVNRVAFSPDGSRLAAASGDGTVQVVPVAGGGPELTLKSPSDPVLGVDIDAGGRIVAAYGSSGTVRLWNADGTGPTVVYDGEDPERDVRFSPDGRLILAVGDDGVARLWDAQSRESVADVAAGPRKLTSAAFSRDGRRFAAASYDGAVRVWTTEGQSELFELRGQLSRVLDVGFGPRDDGLVSAGDDGSARVWDASGIQAFHGRADLTTNADYSPSGRWIATGGWDGDVRLWDAATGDLVRTLRGKEGYTPAYFSPVLDELAIGRDATSSVLRWKPPAPRPRLVDRFPPGSGINVAQFDPTGTRFVSADFKAGKIVIRDLRSNRTWRLGRGPEFVVDAQASPDGRQAAAAGEDGVLYIWELARTDRPVRRLPGHVGHINTLDYSADGRIVTAGADRTIRVWNPQSGRQFVLHGHGDEVNAALFTSGGARILSASADGTVRLWDVRRGEPLVTLEEEPDVPLYDVSQGPDGMLATLDDNQVVRVFRCGVCGGVAQVRTAARALRPRQLTAEERGRYLATVR